MKTKVVKRQKNTIYDIEKAMPLKPMEKEKLEKQLLTLPYYSDVDITVSQYKEALEAQKFIEENYKSTVTGLWYFIDQTFGGAPQLLVRTTNNFDYENIDNVFKRLHLNSDLFKIFTHDILYEIDRDIYSGDTIIYGTQKKLLKEIYSGRLYTIYDINRE